MPCNTRNTASLDLTLANPAMLADALKAAGYTVTTPATGVVSFYGNGVRSGHWQNGKLDISTSSGDNPETIANGVKRAYSAEVVRRAARTFGASVTQDTNNKNKMTLRLRQGRG